MFGHCVLCFCLSRFLFALSFYSLFLFSCLCFFVVLLGTVWLWLVRGGGCVVWWEGEWGGGGGEGGRVLLCSS